MIAEDGKITKKIAEEILFKPILNF